MSSSPFPFFSAAQNFCAARVLREENEKKLPRLAWFCQCREKIFNQLFREGVKNMCVYAVRRRQIQKRVEFSRERRRKKKKEGERERSKSWDCEMCTWIFDHFGVEGCFFFVGQGVLKNYGL